MAEPMGRDSGGPTGDQAAVDLAYDPRLTVANADDLIADRAAASTAALARMRPLTLAYGPSEAEHLDLYRPGEANAPVHLFIHGGFWRSFSARDYAFVAPPLVDQGVLVAVVNYGLCPEVTIDEIVRQCRAALAWAWRYAAEHGGDPDRITVSGHSAGGHLAAMLAAGGWQRDQGLPDDVVKGVCTISGLFDLEPLARSWLQPILRLTPDTIRRNSPIHHPPAAPLPLLVAVGEKETDAFHQQSLAYLDGLRDRGMDGRSMVVSGRNHIDILQELGGGGRLNAAILRMARRQAQR